MSVPFGILAIALTVHMANMLEAPQPETPLRIVWDLHVAPERAHVVQWLADRGWCWGIEVPPYASKEDVLPVAKQGFTIVGQIHAHPKTREWHWTRRGMETPDIESFIKMLHQVNQEVPQVQFFMEDDSAGVGFSAEYLRNPPATHAEAKTMLDDYLETAMKEVVRYPGVNPWAMAGFAGTAHHYARHGAKCIVIERANDDIEDLQTAVAFARGAARQFGCEWGIDLSLWWGVIYGCVQDLPASFYTRHLWLSYISGSQIFRIEGGDLLVRPEGPTTVATAVDAFARVAKDVYPGDANVPIAVLLPQDHGWMTPAYWRTTNEAWNYARLPYRQGERAVDGFFGAAFPGSVYAQDPFPKGCYEEDEPPASPFALSCITPEFAPTPEQEWAAEPPLPFGAYKNRNAARKDFFQHQIDPAPYRPMGDSRWGDIIDVLTDDADYEALAAYKVLVILGPVTITEALRAKIARYVSSGGILLWAAGAATPAEEALVGAALQPELRTGRAWQWREEAFQQEAFRYCPVVREQDDVAAVETLAATRSGNPLVLKHSVGAGTVYTCLLPWFEAGHSALSALALRLLDEIITPVQPVVVTGPPVAWVSSCTEETFYIAVANHDDAAWQGTVMIPKHIGTFVTCRNLIDDCVVDYAASDAGLTVEASIEPYGTLVLACEFEKR